MSLEEKLVPHHQPYTASTACIVPPPTHHQCTTQPMTRSRRSSCHKPVDHLHFGRREFNKQRKLFIQNVPPVNHQDVREYMGQIIAADIVISKRLRHVIIALKCGDDVDLALSALNGRTLAGCPVQLELYPRRMMLYICGIPLHYTDESYRGFLSAYGEVETAFLSLTDSGESRGYGFVEFAHNRATLVKAQQAINGSTLESSQLYCGLVPDSIRTYEQTFSTTLFCVCMEHSLIPDRRLARTLQSASRFNLADGSTLHVLECAETQYSDRIWYSGLNTADTNTPYLHYSVPGLSAHELCDVIQGAQRQDSFVDVGKETKEVIQGLFPSQPQLVLSLEKLVSQLQPTTGAQPLNISTILNLAKFLRSTKDKQPLTSMPVPQSINGPTTVLEPSFLDNHNGVVCSNPVLQYNGPMTRSRYLASSSRNQAFASQRTQLTSASGWREWPPQLVEQLNSDAMCAPLSGPVDQRVNKQMNTRCERRSPGQAGRKRRNSGRSRDVTVGSTQRGWSVWEGLGSLCPWGSNPPPTPVAVSGAHSAPGKENIGISCSSIVCEGSSEPAAKKPFRKTPGAEKRERRLIRAVASPEGHLMLSRGENCVELVHTTPKAAIKSTPVTQARSLPVGQHCQGLNLLLSSNKV